MIATGAPPQRAHPTKRLRHTLAGFGLRLIEPAAAVPEPMRRQARLLAGLLLALFLLIVAGIAAFSLALASYNPLPGFTFPVTLFGAGLLAPACWRWPIS